MQNNHQSLCIATLNISGLLSNILYAEHCLNRTDILVIQDHWLYPHSLGFLQTFHEDFTGWGRLCNSLKLDSIWRRGKGGYCNSMEENT